MEKEKEKGIHITTPLYQTCTTTIKDHYLSALGRKSSILGKIVNPFPAHTYCRYN